MALETPSSPPSPPSSTAAPTASGSSSVTPPCEFLPLTVVGDWDFEVDGYEPPVRWMLFDVTKNFRGIPAKKIESTCWDCKEVGYWRFFSRLYRHSAFCYFCDDCADLQRLEINY